MINIEDLRKNQVYPPELQEAERMYQKCRRISEVNIIKPENSRNVSNYANIMQIVMIVEMLPYSTINLILLLKLR